MKKKLDLDNWVRKDHFHFFRQFEEPFWGVVITIDCTHAYATAKAEGVSFFLYYLHKALAAVNDIEPFRYRIEEDEVYVYDEVNASPTIDRGDGSFGFGYMDYYPDFADFNDEAKKEIEKVRSQTKLVPSSSEVNVIHFSSLPWLNFTSISHARSFSFKDSIPKISFGKMTEANGIKSMPVSIHVHHALMDGYHVGQFAERFQELMNGKL